MGLIHVGGKQEEKITTFCNSSMSRSYNEMCDYFRFTVDKQPESAKLTAQYLQNSETGRF